MAKAKLQPTVMVKFSFTNEDRMPLGIREKNRATDQVVDAGHAAAELRRAAAGSERGKGFAKLGDLQAANQRGAVGRHREGRVDTGEPVVQNLQNADVSQLLAQLQAAGFTLTGAAKFERQRDKGKPLQVLELVFSREGEAFPLLEHQQQAVDSLLTEASWIVHVWDNPGSRTTTVNLVGMNPDRRVDNRLTITPSGDIVSAPAT